MFKIKGYAGDFYSGSTNDNRQVVMGLLCPNLVAYFFSAEGILLNCEVRLWDFPAPRNGGAYRIYDQQFVQHLHQQFETWQNTIGFQAQGISIQPFFDEDNYVGAQEMPLDLQDLSWCESKDELDEAQASLENWKQWNKDGVFVFYWAKDYFMSAEGEVLST